MMDLGTPSSTASEAWAINDADQIAGTKGHLAFRWEDGTFTNLYPSSGCTHSRAYDINTQGDVVGWAFNCDEKVRSPGMLWTDEEVYILSPFEHDQQSIARALNDMGQVVGYSYSSTSHHAVLWSGEEVIDLGLGPGIQSAALDINDSGEIVGYWGSGSQTSQHRATLWRGDEMIDLNNAIPPQEDWLLYEAWSVNASGQIVGFGLGPTGVGHAFLLTPCAAADFYCDGAVGPEDLALLLSTWGPCPEGDDCPADFDNDNSVGPTDLAQLLANWGQYP